MTDSISADTKGVIYWAEDGGVYWRLPNHGTGPIEQAWIYTFAEFNYHMDHNAGLFTNHSFIPLTRLTETQRIAVLANKLMGGVGDDDD